MKKNIPPIPNSTQELSFLEEIKKVTSRFDCFDKEETIEVIKYIKNYTSSFSLKKEGLCINCKKAKIKYNELCITHRKLGDE